ncbi:MAG TPA: PKD domain-containing protein, partial [Anditalea sp.]|nr:PKD domain-containing protein [Anditalea sp.]
HIPLAIRTSGELVKVLAAEDGTHVTIDGVPVDILNAGQFKTYNFNSTDIREIKSSKPTSVSVLAKSQECNDLNLGNYNQGDPFMILYSPNEQMLQSVTFQAMNVVAIENNFVSILVKTASKGNTVLDGTNIGNSFQAVPVNPEYSYAIVNITGGSHSLSNPDGFIGYVYGFGFLESYGYSVGASLNNLNFETGSEYEFEVIGEQVACLDEEGTWKIIPDNENFQYYIWDFGDGTEKKEGQEVVHTYTELGKYTVKINASISENSCDSQEDITFEIEVFESYAEIEGVDRVCPLVEDHWYEATELNNVSRMEWSVEGGEIIKSEEYRVLVKWGEPNEEAKLIGVPIGQNGCPGKPIEFLVNVNRVIEPGMPTGPIQVCFDPDLEFEYEVDQIISNRSYQWFIEGGEIITSNASATIKVQWNQPGIIGKVWYREYSENDELCEGTSGELAVTVNAAITFTVESKRDINCYGENTGEINLLIEGGDNNYTYIWSHDPNQNLLQSKNLPAGIYSIKAIDGQGCEAEIEVTLTEPPLLEMSLLSLEMTSCFGRDDGQAIASITGGSPPYRFVGEDYTLQGDRLSLFNLPMGNHSISVYDALDCEVQISFEIESPLPLEADVRVLKPACPGEPNGELLVIPNGGVAPYLFTWDYLQTEGEELIGVPGGEYTATIVDASGCISFGTGTVNEEAPKVRMPSGFRPGDGGVNGFYEGVSNCTLDYQLSIYNRWGELIYSGNKGWDGTVNEVEALPDAYTYIIKYSYFLDGQTWVKESRGIFTLVR